MKKYFVVIIAIIFTGCWEEFPAEVHQRYNLINNSSHSIGWYESSLYPDTSLPETNTDVIYELLASGKGNWYEPKTQTWNDTMSIFIFHSDTLKKYSWQEVRDGYKFLKRYDLSLEDLKRMNYTITYP